jgi:4-hydroxyphenylpyruvate dioxygenase
MKEIKNVEYGLEKIFEGAQDFLPLLGTDYVEFYVGNAKQSAHFYKTAFGFQSHAYAGLKLGVKDRASYVLKQDKIRLVLTTALVSDSAYWRTCKKTWRWGKSDCTLGGRCSQILGRNDQTRRKIFYGTYHRKR